MEKTTNSSNKRVSSKKLNLVFVHYLVGAALTKTKPSSKSDKYKICIIFTSYENRSCFIAEGYEFPYGLNYYNFF